MVFRFSGIAHASPKNVSDAARAVIQECVIRRRIGGRASQIGEIAIVQICSNDQPVGASLPRAKKVIVGGDDQLGVLVSDPPGYRPSCAANVTTTEGSCRYIIDEMDKTVRSERFGRSIYPGVDVALPLTLRAREYYSELVLLE